MGVSGALCVPGMGQSAVDQEKQKHLEKDTKGRTHKPLNALRLQPTELVACSAVRIDGHNADLLQSGAPGRDIRTKELSIRTL